MNSNNDKKWRVLSERYIIQRPWLTARCETIQLPNGVVNDEYYVLEYPEWVNVIAITTEGKFVFVRQYRHAYGDTLTEICAGVCEKDEAPLLAAQRELQEETGYTGGEWREFMQLSPNATTCNNLSHSFIATGVEQTTMQHLDRTEDIDIVLLSRDQVLSMLRNDEIKQAMMAAPLWRYFAYEEGRE